MFGNKSLHQLVFIALLTLIMGKSSIADTSKPLTVVTFQQAPFAVEGDIKDSGLIVEVLDELFRRAGIEYHMVFYPLKRGMAMSENLDNHCVLPIERSQDRETNYRWVGPVLISRYGLFSSDSTSKPLITLDDASKYSIGSFLGSGVGEYLEGMGYNVEFTSNASLNLKKVQRNRIDLWASELVSANWIMQQNKVDLGEPELVFFTSLRAMACNKNLDNSRYNAMQSSLEDMYKDGFMHRVATKYGARLLTAQYGVGASF
ncbi:substrate-binding periplasmic protein [Shewanella maritima]|uniref:substrate-binding periplasmic protein n=1 Tax=Shewanella maritima TaxID=2520507 RepID=UPI0013EE6D36|nr:transporter substrate-binding domain-containing protein [Shewanella maritima]